MAVVGDVEVGREKRARGSVNLNFIPWVLVTCLLYLCLPPCPPLFYPLEKINLQSTVGVKGGNHLTEEKFQREPH